jgi:hypothetical protein
MLLISLQLQAQDNQIIVEKPDEETVAYTLPDDIRMGDAISRSLPNKNIYWPAARFGSKALQGKAERERLKVLMRLDELQTYAQKHREKALYGAAEQLYKQIEQGPLKAAYYLGVPWETIRINTEFNPKLTEKGVKESRFVLTVNDYPQFYRLLGLTSSPQRYDLPTPTSPVSLKEVLSTQALNPVADNGHLWHIALNGEVSYQPAASYNAQQAAVCYKHNPKVPFQLGTEKQCFPERTLTGGAVIFIGFSESELPEQFSDLNRHIVQLIKHHNYAQN